MSTWRNVHLFSGDVPETAHNGHRVTELRRYVPDPEEPDAVLIDVRCECGQDFTAFAEEVVA